MGRKKRPGTSAGHAARRQEARQQEVGALFDRVVAIMDGARERVVRRVNHEMLIAYWHIGREIVEQVQEGEGRAAYGRQVLGELSKRLTDRYGRGFSFTNLRYFRLFYKAYATRRPELGSHLDADSGDLGSVEPGPVPGARGAHVRADNSDVSRCNSILGDPLSDSGRIHHTPCDEFRSDSSGPLDHPPGDSTLSAPDSGPTQGTEETDQVLFHLSGLVGAMVLGTFGVD